ncbi:hypothetical protein [Thermogemmatispora sp.]|uniref:hypothetical protein n=1 Tax=Thermogemmatispora sp. TaxID=1968838 RepID=UPI001DE5C5E8|nr:hypothetical protein [Thermogemmatispora sp.]MBX5448699.1 hypothetical protein [Thermogemmatispora sp.]
MKQPTASEESNPQVFLPHRHRSHPARRAFGKRAESASRNPRWHLARGAWFAPHQVNSKPATLTVERQIPTVILLNRRAGERGSQPGGH